MEPEGLGGRLELSDNAGWGWHLDGARGESCTSPPLPAHGASAPCSGDGFSPRGFPLQSPQSAALLLQGLPGRGPQRGAQGQRLSLLAGLAPCSAVLNSRKSGRETLFTAAGSRLLLPGTSRMASKGREEGRGSLPGPQGIRSHLSYDSWAR